MTGFWPVLRKSLRDQRRSLIGWTVALTALVWIEAALWPTIEDMPDFQDFLNQYPDGLQKLFDIEAMATGQGFMNAELFSLMLPILFVVFAIGRGVRSTAVEEEAGTLEVVLVSPISRTTLIVAKAAAVAVGTTLLGAVLAIALVGASLVFDLGIGVSSATTGSLAMVLLGVEFGFVAIAVAAATGRRAEATAAAGAVAVAAYVLYVAGQFVEQLQTAADWTPMGQVLDVGPLGAGLQVSYGWMALSALVVVGLAVPLFSRRDVRAH
jgi:ABC-2 type transport system permease protein